MTVTTEVSKTTRDFVGTTRRLLIDGQWVEAASGKTFVTTDPATEQEITHVAHGEAEDIDRAVAAARRAFEEGPWRTITPSARGQIIWRLADLLEKHADEFAELEALDNGKPLSVARTADVPLAVDLLPLHGRVGDEDRGQHDSDLRPRHIRLYADGAGGRGRADHPVELPATDGGVEAGPGARHRVHRRTQASRADPAVGATPGRALPGGGPARRGAQHRHRLRRRRRSPGRAPRRGQGCVHRLHRGRQAGRSGGRGQSQEGLP